MKAYYPNLKRATDETKRKIINDLVVKPENELSKEFDKFFSDNSVSSNQKKNPNEINQFAMLTQAGTTSDVVTFTSAGLVTGVSGFTPGAYYYYVPGTGFTTQGTPDNFVIGWALSATEFYVVLFNPLCVNC